MGKGKTGVETNVIIKVPNREKISCNCRKCTYFKKNVCELGRKLFTSKCKWYITFDDYSLNLEERKEVQNKNNVSKEIRKERSGYNKGFGSIKVETADLSKYRGLK